MALLPSDFLLNGEFWRPDVHHNKLGAQCPLWVACSTGQCNTACSLSAGVSNPKVLRGR
jgi:hypothetical protein